MPAKRKPKPRRKPAAPAAPDPARLDAAVRLRLDGAQLHDLLGYANDPGPDAALARGGPPWGLTEAAAAALVAAADDLLVARAERSPERAAALLLARHEALYARAVNAGDLPTALAVLRDQAQLLGMYPNVAELRKLVRAQDDVIRELEAERDHPALRPAEDGPGPAGEAGQDHDGEEADE